MFACYCVKYSVRWSVKSTFFSFMLAVGTLLGRGFFPPLKRRKRNLCTDLLDAVQKFGQINKLKTGLKPVITSLNFSKYHNVEQPLGCYEPVLLSADRIWAFVHACSIEYQGDPCRGFFFFFREGKNLCQAG